MPFRLVDKTLSRGVQALKNCVCEEDVGGEWFIWWRGEV